ncbi:MAG: hypothetical protein K6B14_07630, partial [Lachnospiraceae bacterium]|nr:hypothetical protein [Lachnospiraceae bacterium]
MEKKLITRAGAVALSLVVMISPLFVSVPVKAGAGSTTRAISPHTATNGTNVFFEKRLMLHRSISFFAIVYTCGGMVHVSGICFV